MMRAIRIWLLKRRIRTTRRRLWLAIADRKQTVMQLIVAGRQVHVS